MRFENRGCTLCSCTSNTGSVSDKNEKNATNSIFKHNNSSREVKQKKNNEFISWIKNSIAISFIKKNSSNSGNSVRLIWIHCRTPRIVIRLLYREIFAYRKNDCQKHDEMETMQKLGDFFFSIFARSAFLNRFGCWFDLICNYYSRLRFKFISNGDFPFFLTLWELSPAVTSTKYLPLSISIALIRLCLHHSLCVCYIFFHDCAATK